MARKYKMLAEAMEAGDMLAEAEIRYKLLAETFEAQPNLRANINAQLERAKAEIVQLRALAPAKPGSASGAGVSGTVVAFDASRFQKNSGA